MLPLWITPQTRLHPQRARPLVRPRALLGSPSRPRNGPIRRTSPEGFPRGRPTVMTTREANASLVCFSTLVDGSVDNSDLASTTVVSSMAVDLWDSGSTALRAQLAEGTWNTWFREVRPVRCEDDVLVLAVPNAVACERIRSSYTGLLTDLLHDAPAGTCFSGRRRHPAATIRSLAAPLPTSVARNTVPAPRSPRRSRRPRRRRPPAPWTAEPGTPSTDSSSVRPTGSPTRGALGGREPGPV
jgi:hypothetical protein